MKKILIGIAVGAIAGVITLLLASHSAAVSTLPPASAVTAQRELPILTHQQEVWIYALEWCESHGVESAVNPKDKDGTPSYYSFQFKPGTFRSYGELYGVIPKGLTDKEITDRLKDYKLQKDIVSFMVQDKAVNWEQQFPDCVKRKIGRPPRQSPTPPLKTSPQNASK